MEYKLKFLGTGSAFCDHRHNWQTNAILQCGKLSSTLKGELKNMLIDCGSDIRHPLDNYKLSYKDIDAVYLTHMHGDHVGGMEWLGFGSYFDPAATAPELFISKKWIETLWSDVLKGGMSSIQNKLMTLNNYFNVTAVEKNGSFEWEGLTFYPVQTVHYMNGFEIVPSYGLKWKIGNTRIFYTGDTQYAPAQIMDFYQESDVIFHDCETSPFKSGVHAHITELATLSKEIKAKMWLMHYQDNISSNFDVENKEIQKAGFMGFVKRDQEFTYTQNQ